MQNFGFIYSRLGNPTVSVLEERIANLENGRAGVACSSGHAAQILALFPLMSPGDNLIASTRLYGGTVQQFSNTIKKFGWNAKFVDIDNFDQVKQSIDKKTKAIFCESISNPGGHITNLIEIGKHSLDCLVIFFSLI